MKNQRYAVAESGYRRRHFLISCLWVAALLNCGGAAWAHHSFAMYDPNKQVELKGTVKEFRFSNPHSLLILSVKDNAGKVTDYTIETNGSFYLARKQGWKRDSLKPGDVIVAFIHPMRDGSPGGDLLNVTLSDGHVLIARPPSSPVPPENKK